MKTNRKLTIATIVTLFVMLFQGSMFVNAAQYSSHCVSFDWPDGTYTSTKFNYDFGNKGQFPSSSELVITGGKLRVTLPANQESGALVSTSKIPAAASYYVGGTFSIPSDFSFGNQNDMKLPIGLGGGTCAAGGETDKDNGWSARLMYNGMSGNFVLYVYDTLRAEWGRIFNTGVACIPGTTYDAEIYILRNTANAFDGAFTVWINGTQVLDESGIKWSNNQVDCDTLIMDWFRGGGGDPPSVTTYGYIHDFWWNTANSKPAAPAEVNIAIDKTATASSYDSSTRMPSKAVDGNDATRWSSTNTDPSWFKVDLGDTYGISHVDRKSVV